MPVQEFMLDEMKDVVEETEKGEEWSALVDKLNLEGQRQLCNGDPGSPIPFPHMTREMIRVYEILCPMKNLIKDYKKTAIPTRVLEIAGLCVMKEYFGKIEVWYDDQSPDPIIVGCDGEDKYLLARWAAELEEYTVLRAKAIARKTEKMRREIVHAKAEIDAALIDLSSYTERWISGEAGWLSVGGHSW